MSFWAGYFTMAAAQGADEATQRGDDPVAGALEGVKRAGWLPVVLAGLLGWFVLTIPVYGVLLEVGFPTKSMFTWIVAAVLVPAPLLVWAWVTTSDSQAVNPGSPGPRRYP